MICNKKNFKEVNYDEPGAFFERSLEKYNEGFYTEAIEDLDKALELVEAGYSSIDEIKKDFDRNRLRVQILRNQYIGLINYDDILEEMDRAEATKIGEIVRKAVLDRYPQAEVQIMGSFRRGAETCGDVDILIVTRNSPHRVSCFFKALPLGCASLSCCANV